MDNKNIPLPRLTGKTGKRSRSDQAPLDGRVEKRGRLAFALAIVSNVGMFVLCVVFGYLIPHLAGATFLHISDDLDRTLVWLFGAGSGMAFLLAMSALPSRKGRWALPAPLIATGIYWGVVFVNVAGFVAGLDGLDLGVLVL